MISIVVTIHNQIEYNKLFIESLRKYTYSPYELIVVDNSSLDGSKELFASFGYKIIETKGNLCYPCSQNIGLREARYGYVAFLNNDIYLSPNWDKYLLEIMENNKLEIISPNGIENMESKEARKKIRRRWNYIGRYFHKYCDYKGLKKIIRRMYGNWERFCQKRYDIFYPKIIDGIAGNCILTKKTLFDKIGKWDKRIQAADWNLYLTLRKREEERKDVKRPKIALGVFVHHFIRATARRKRTNFTCRHEKINLLDKWSREDIERYWWE